MVFIPFYGSEGREQMETFHRSFKVKQKDQEKVLQDGGLKEDHQDNPSRSLGGFKLDLKDPYYHVPLAREILKIFRFAILIDGKIEVFFKVLPFGLTTAPWAFSTVLKSIKKELRLLGITITFYLDDLLILARSKQEALVQTQIVIEVLQRYGFIINWEILSLKPQSFGLSRCYPGSGKPDFFTPKGKGEQNPGRLCNEQKSPVSHQKGLGKVSGISELRSPVPEIRKALSETYPGLDEEEYFSME